MFPKLFALHFIPRYHMEKKAPIRISREIKMKKILIVMFIVFFTTASALCGEFEKTLKKAEQGNVNAQYDLGWKYFFGQGIVQDRKLGVYWWKKAAEQGNADAQFNLGFMYYDGRGITQDYLQAVYWWEKAAEQGNANAQFNLGLMYDEGQGVSRDYKQAAYWYTKAADQGIAKAQLNLGLLYKNGQGVVQDYKKAVFWHTKAAEQGHTVAQYNLGLMYVDGYGVPRDYKQAVYWFTKAAEQGDVDAQKNLGTMYYFGKGVPQNYQLAYVWLSLAASQGYETATKNRDITAEKLTSQQLSEAQDLAAQIQYQIDNPPESQTQPPAKADSCKIIGSGTGFFITKDGYILTCLHVVQDGTRIEVYVGDKIYPASLIQSDSNIDLAILKVNGSFQALAFSPNRSAKMGQDVFSVGYPNPGLQGVSPKYTKGTISSLTGFQDDLRLYQISIPIQPGNSGGALLDEYGNILGVLVAMLCAETTFQMTGSLSQNVNYAVKSLYAQAMIDTVPEVAGKLLAPSKSKTDAIDHALQSTVMVVCQD